MDLFSYIPMNYVTYCFHCWQHLSWQLSHWRSGRCPGCRHPWWWCSGCSLGLTCNEHPFNESANGTAPFKIVNNCLNTNHKHLSMIDWSMAHTASIVCLFSTVIGPSQKKEKSPKCLERCGTNSKHITKLEQYISFRHLWYQHFFLFREIWWSKFSSIFKCCPFFPRRC